MTDLPAPPVPADCDLRSFPYLPLDVVRLRDSRLTATATGDEFRAAVLLWCAAWHQVPASSLPTDDRELAALAGYGRDVKGWRKVREMAVHGWSVHADGRMYHQVVAEKAAEAWHQRQMQKAKAEKRWGKATAPGDGTPTADAAASPTADAPAMQQRQNRTEQNRENPPPSPSADSASEKSQKAPAATAAANLSVRIKSGNIGKIRDAVQSGSLMGLVHAFGGNADRGEEWARDAGEFQLGTILAVFDWRAKNRQPIREPSGLRVGLAAWHEQPQEFRRKWIAELLADLGLAGQDGQA